MAFVEWEDRFSVHVAQIDQQHKHLLDLINQLFEACSKDRQTAEQFFKDSIKESVHYVREHFSYEEQLMISYGYPEYQRHKQDHEEFIKKILEYVKEFESGKRFVPNNYVRFLKEWLLQHIAVSDKRYERFFQEKLS